MAITNYGELKVSIGDWMARNDLGGAIPDFIALAHAEFNRRLRLRKMEATATIAPDVNGLYALPADYIATRNVVWLGSPRRTLDGTSTQYLDSNYGFRQNGVPLVFAVEGNGIRIAPAASADTPQIELRYYQKIPALVADTDTNWLLTKEPGLYLYGALAQSAPYIGDDSRLATWAAMATQIVESLQQEDNRSKFAYNRMLTVGVTP